MSGPVSDTKLIISNASKAPIVVAPPLDNSVGNSTTDSNATNITNGPPTVPAQPQSFLNEGIVGFVYRESQTVGRIEVIIQELLANFGGPLLLLAGLIGLWDSNFFLFELLGVSEWIQKESMSLIVFAVGFWIFTKVWVWAVQRYDAAAAVCGILVVLSFFGIPVVAIIQKYL